MKKAELLYILFLLLIGLSACGNNVAPQSSSEADDYTPAPVVFYPPAQEEAEATEEYGLVICPETTQVLDFQQPDAIHYAIQDVIFDAEHETYAIVYAVSTDESEERSLQTFHPENASLHVQIFDSQGIFLRGMETSITPSTGLFGPRDSSSSSFRNGIITFSYFPQPSRTRRYFVIINTDTEGYAAVQNRYVIEDGDYFLLNDAGIQGTTTTRDITFSLYRLEQLVASIEIALKRISFDPLKSTLHADNRFTLDTQSRTAIWGNNEITFHLYFNTESWVIERHYTQEHLNMLLDTSPDGRWSVYATNFSGDIWFMMDLVSLNTETGEITYMLTDWEGAGMFVSDGRFLFDNRSQGRFTLVDVENAQIISEIDVADISTFVYDAAHDLLIVAWFQIERDTDYQSRQAPIMLNIFDRDLSHIRTIDTGLSDFPIQINAIFPLELEIEGDGYIVIGGMRDEERDQFSARVRYID